MQLIGELAIDSNNMNISGVLTGGILIDYKGEPWFAINTREDSRKEICDSGRRTSSRSSAIKNRKTWGSSCRAKWYQVSELIVCLHANGNSCL